MSGGSCVDLTPLLDELYRLAHVLDGRSRAVPVVYEPLTVTPFGGVILVAGEIDLDSGPRLAAALVPLADPGGEVRVDMAAVTFLGSSGLRMLNRVAETLGPTGRLVDRPQPLGAAGDRVARRA